MTTTANVLNTLSSGIQGYQAGTKSRKDAQHLQSMRAEQLATAQTARAAQPDPQGVKAAADAQNRVLQAQNEALAGKFANQEFNQGLDLFTQSTDARHLNRPLQTNKFLQERFPDVARFDVINMDDEADIIGFNAAYDSPELPEGQAGAPEATTPQIVDTDASFLRANPNLLKRYVKVIPHQGHPEIVDLNAVKGITGYYAQKTKEDIAAETAMLNMEKLRRDALGEGSAARATTAMTNAEALAAAKDRVAAGTGTSADRELIRGNVLTHKRAQSEDEQEIAVGAEVVEDLYNSFEGGREGYYSHPLPEGSEEKERAITAANNIIKLDRSQKVTTEERKTYRDISTLLHLGDVAAEGLDESAVGFIDNPLLGLGKLLKGAPDSARAAARSAYNSFYNTVLNMRSGATVTAGEAERLRAEFGSLNQQLPDVLIGLRNQIQMLVSKLDGVGNFKHPIIPKAYLGHSQEQAEDLVSRLNQTLNIIAEGTVTEGSGPARKKAAPPSRLSSLLDSIKAKREAQ